MKKNIKEDEDMAKVTLMDAGKTVEMEGKAVIAFVVNPADVKGGGWPAAGCSDTGDRIRTA